MPHIESSNPYAEISLNIDKQEYSAGELATGTVNVCSEIPFGINKVIIALKGIERVHFPFKKGLRMCMASHKDKICEHKEILSNAINVTVVKSSNFAFKFQLPQNIAPSYAITDDSDDTDGKIFYYFKATAIPSSKAVKQIGCIAPITVNGQSLSSNVMKSCLFSMYNGCCLCKNIISLTLCINDNIFKIGETIPLSITKNEGNIDKFFICIDRTISMRSESGKLIKKKKNKISTARIITKAVKPTWNQSTCNIEINMTAELSIKALNDLRKHHSYYSKSICCEYYIKLMMGVGNNDDARNCVIYLIE